MMKKAFYFFLRAIFVLEIFTFLAWLFGYVENGLFKRAMVDLNVDDVTEWTINN